MLATQTLHVKYVMSSDGRCDPGTIAVRLLEGDLTGRIINAFYATYDELGFGFLESVYANSFEHELRVRGMSVLREPAIDVWFKGKKVGHFRADMVVDGKVLIEIKASRTLDASDHKQVLSYLRGTDLEVALLLHFGPKAAFHRSILENPRKSPRQVP
jgi:GxxExxY protein